jgi:lipid II:glycine glycyltransferase (peptidoglycan interpeptide bridge formation enzyme)
MSLTVEIDTVDAEEWHRLLQEFDDASIFQTWAYGSARWGENNLCHAVIKDGDEVVGLAQAVLFGVPLFGKTLAYVILGPICHRRGAAGGMEQLKSTICALREEYVVRRRLCLRLRLWPYDISADVRAALVGDGTWEEARPLHNTYVLDLSLSESRLRSAMDKKWRANLRKAEQCGLTVSQHGRDGIPLFLDLHRQMRERKHLVRRSGAMWPPIHHSLPEPLQPRIFVCWHDRTPVASAIVSAIGNCAFYLDGASGDAALEVRGGYFLQWAIVRWLKENERCRWYDLHGVGATPGVRQFKRGLVGARAPKIPLNEIEARGRHLSALLVGAGTRLYEMHRKLRGPWARLSRRR